MRRFVFTTVSVVLMSLPFGTSARGQFQNPSKEELQMTEDPKAPGAMGVYLQCEEVQDDLAGTWTFYARLKILSEKGIAKATVRLAHDARITGEVEGRTIHKDGTVFPLTEKPSELTDYRTKRREIDSLVFTLPSAAGWQHPGVPRQVQTLRISGNAKVEGAEGPFCAQSALRVQTVLGFWAGVYGADAARRSRVDSGGYVQPVPRRCATSSR